MAVLRQGSPVYDDNILRQSPGPSGGQCKVGIGASSSTSSPASEEDADLAAVTARCIISRTPNLAGLPLFVGPLLPLPLVLLTDPAPLPFPEVVTAASGMVKQKQSGLHYMQERYVPSDLE